MIKDETKKLRPWLESWGVWRRLTLVVGYPSGSASCNPDIHTATPVVEPPFKMPAFVYSSSLSPEENAKLNLDRMKRAERLIREFHHVKRTEGKVKRTGIVPDYDPQWRMNLIDRQIQALRPRLKEVITLRYEHEFKVNEIPRLIGRTLDTVNRRMAIAHECLRLIPGLMVSREAPLRSIEGKKSSNLPLHCDNAASGF